MSVQIQIQIHTQIQIQIHTQIQIQIQIQIQMQMQILYPSKDRDLGNKDAFFLPRSQSFCPAS